GLVRVSHPNFVAIDREYLGRFILRHPDRLTFNASDCLTKMTSGPTILVTPYEDKRRPIERMTVSFVLHEIQRSESERFGFGHFHFCRSWLQVLTEPNH